MSFGVSRVGPGIGTAPIRIAPSIAAYHSATRGSMMKTWSPFSIPAASRARAAFREFAANSLAVCRLASSPVAVNDRTAGASGSSAAQDSTIASTGL
jgi:hypothetical protein